MKYLVFDRPGGHIDIKVNHARIQEDCGFPSAELLNNFLKYNLVEDAWAQTTGNVGGNNDPCMVLLPALTTALRFKPSNIDAGRSTEGSINDTTVVSRIDRLDEHIFQSLGLPRTIVFSLEDVKANMKVHPSHFALPRIIGTFCVLSIVALSCLADAARMSLRPRPRFLFWSPPGALTAVVHAEIARYLAAVLVTSTKRA